MTPDVLTREAAPKSPGVPMPDADVRSAPIKIVSIAHPAMQRGTGRMRYLPLAARAGQSLSLIIPDRWREYGRSLAPDPAEAELDIRVLPIALPEAGPAKWYLHFYRGLGRLLRTLRPDVIHLWEEPWGLVALQAVLLRALFLPRAAIVLETDQNILRPLPPPFESLRRYTLKRTDTLIVRGPEALAVARATGYAGPTVTVEYCIDARNFHPEGRAEARRALGVDGLAVGYVGRLTEAKGLSKVIAALARCQTRDITLLLLGDGPDHAALRRAAEERGVADRVRFLPQRPGAGVGDFMRGLDVLVLLSQTTPTWKEQFGRAIIEAQACGTPVIGSDSGSIPGVVAKGGWIVGEDDVEGLAALLDRLAGDPAEIAAKAAAGLAQVGRRFTPEKIAADLLAAFASAIARRTGRGI
jgi:glycosyltransferase involved in cell wall biosynthesis